MSSISPLTLPAPLPYQTYYETNYDSNVGESQVNYELQDLEAQYGYILPQLPFDQSYQVPETYWTQQNYSLEPQQYQYSPAPYQYQYTSDSAQFNYQASQCTYNNYYDDTPLLVVHQSQSQPRTRIPPPVISTISPLNLKSNPVSNLSKLSKAEDLDLELGIRKPFISKLYYLLRTPQLFNDVLQWSTDGSKFIMAPSSRFTEVLVDIFAHSSDSAFTRQLNTYAFRRLNPTELALSFPNSSEFGLPLKSLSAWEHKSMHRDNPSLANTMVPVPSKARTLHAQKKQALINKGTIVPRKIRMSIKK